MKTDLLPLNAIERNRDLKRMGKDAVSAVMIGFVIVGLLVPMAANAQSSTGLPWVKFTETLACELQGPWVKWLAVIAVALGGIMFGLGELSGPFQRTMQIAGGFSIAVGALTVVPLLLPGSGSLACRGSTAFNGYVNLFSVFV